MNVFLDFLIILLILSGLFFVFSGIVGVFRFKDTLSKLQASTTISTLGVIFTLLAVIIFSLRLCNIAAAIKISLIIVFIIITSPITSHIMAKTYSATLSKDKAHKDK